MSRHDRTGEAIYSAEYLHETQNKITEDINEKKKTESHATWIEFSFKMRGTGKICSSAVRKMENWNGELMRPCRCFT